MSAETSIVCSACHAARLAQSASGLSELRCPGCSARFPVVEGQFRANVAYLMNDRKGAIAALEKAIGLEPDNALFRENLRRMQQKSVPQPE